MVAFTSINIIASDGVLYDDFQRYGPHQLFNHILDGDNFYHQIDIIKLWDNKNRVFSFYDDSDTDCTLTQSMYTTYLYGDENGNGRIDADLREPFIEARVFVSTQLSKLEVL